MPIIRALGHIDKRWIVQCSMLFGSNVVFLYTGHPEFNQTQKMRERGMLTGF